MEFSFAMNMEGVVIVGLLFALHLAGRLWGSK